MERTVVSLPGAGGGLGPQTRVVSPGAQTIVDAFAPYDPTIQWQGGHEPTVAWVLPEPRPTPNPCLVGLGSAGLAVAVVLGFCMGRAIPVSAAYRSPATTRVIQNPAPAAAPSGPVVLPQAPDMSRVYPVVPTAPSATAAWRTPTWIVPPAPPVSIRPVVRTHAAGAPGTVRMSAVPVPMPPPVQLYGSRRLARGPAVTTWRLTRGD